MSRLSRLKVWGKRAGLVVLGLLVLGGAAAAWFFRPLPIPAAPALDSLNASAEHGEYLATIGNCAACHTAPDGEHLAGGVRFVTDFGTLYSTNITPDREHGIGSWSFAQFHRAMKHGIDANGEHLYPAFPYTSFAGMSDDDLASLFLYLAGQPAVATPDRANAMTFPFGQRDLLHFWQRMFHDAAPAVADAAQGEEWNRGAYLVQAVAHCGECHSPRNLLGGVDRDRLLHGGIYVDQVRSGAYRRWSAVDITPGLHGIGHWNAQDIEAYLAEGVNRHTVVHGPMVEVWRATQQLSPADRAAMATYLGGADASPERWNLPNLQWGRDAGEIVYTVHCGTCHLPDGDGDPTLGVSLHRNPLVQAEDPASLINVILYGPDLPPAPFSVGRSRMKPFGRRLSDQDIADVASYLRQNFGNNASAVSARQVADQR